MREWKYELHRGTQGTHSVNNGAPAMTVRGMTAEAAIVVDGVVAEGASVVASPRQYR